MSQEFKTNASYNFTGPENRRLAGVYKKEYHTVLLALALAIILHNSLVLYLYIKRRPLQTSTNLVLASTACADLLTGALLIPFLVCSAALGGRAPDLNPLYFTSNVISDLVTMAIVLNLSLVTIERYMALCHPYFHQSVISKALIRKAIGTVWIVSLLIAVVQISWSYPVIMGKKRDLSEVYQVYSISILVSVFFVPTACMIYCQVRMFLIVHRFAIADSMRGLHTGTVARPRVKTMLVFLAMFLNVFICWSPLMTMRLVMDVSPHVTPSRETLEVLVMLRCFSSLFNPVICVWCKKDFKKAFSTVFCRPKPTRKADLHRLQHSVEKENHLHETVF